MKTALKGCLRELLVTALAIGLLLVLFAVYVGTVYLKTNDWDVNPIAFSDEGYVGGILGVKLPKYAAKAGEDTHGGFHGDGIAWYVYDFDEASAERLLSQIENAPHWHPLPMTDKTRAFLFGDEADGMHYASLVEKLDFGLPPDGYWFVFDEQAEGEARYGDAALFSPERYSANVKLAEYDAEEGRLLFFELDT